MLCVNLLLLVALTRLVVTTKDSSEVYFFFISTRRTTSLNNNNNLYKVVYVCVCVLLLYVVLKTHCTVCVLAWIGCVVHVHCADSRAEEEIRARNLPPSRPPIYKRTQCLHKKSAFAVHTHANPICMHHTRVKARRRMYVGLVCARVGS